MGAPAWVAAVEGWLGARRRWRGINRFPDPQRYFGDGGIAAAEATCTRANRDLLGFLRPDRITAPAPVDRRLVAGRRGIVPGEEWTFDSPLPSGDPANDRVRLRVYRHRDCTERDRVVLFHHPIHQRDWGTWVWFLTPLIRHVPVALMAAPHHFERAGDARFPGERSMNPNPARLFEAIRQWAWDHAASVAALRADGRAVSGIVGYSFGAFQTLLLASAGEVACPIVSIASTNRYAFGLCHGALGEGLLRAMEQVGIDRERLTHLVDSLQLERHVRGLRDRRVLFVRAAHDTIDPDPSGLRLQDALRPERALELDAGHGTLVFLRGRILAEALDFLRAHDAVAGPTQATASSTGIAS
jgi:hypothetical protein